MRYLLILYSGRVLQGTGRHLIELVLYQTSHSNSEPASFNLFFPNCTCPPIPGRQVPWFLCHEDIGLGHLLTFERVTQGASTVILPYLPSAHVCHPATLHHNCSQEAEKPNLTRGLCSLGIPKENMCSK